MARIDQLLEQTAFLLEEQKGMQSFYEKTFAMLYQLIDDSVAKSEAEHAGDSLDRLDNIRVMVKEQEEEILEQLADDVLFLEEQIAGLKQVCEMDDTTKVDEIASEMIGDQKELQSFDIFKGEIEEEIKAAQDSFGSVVDDMKAALEEGSLEELEAFLKEQREAAQKEREEMEKEEECGDSDCSSCKTSCGSNIFKGLDEDGPKDFNDDDEDFDDDDFDDDDDDDDDFDDDDEEV